MSCCDELDHSVFGVEGAGSEGFVVVSRILARLDNVVKLLKPA